MATSTPSQLAIATLYTAAFNRAPDAAGFDFWLQAYQRGASLSGLAGTFLGTPEGQATYSAGLSSQAFVAAFYTSVFGRSADAGGLKFWSDALDALGGAGSATAKATLMVDIIGVASTPITSRPEGLSDAAYAQTVADRARFINKAEFGVYFAAELRSNDLSLAKQLLAMVTADPASVGVARALAEQPVTPPVVPPVIVPALTSADDVAAITSKLAAYGGTAATADTTGMSAAQLKALAVGVSKFLADGLTGALALSSTVTSVEAGSLLAKYSGGTASANATGMDTAYLTVLAGAATKFSAAGIATPTLLVNTLDNVTTETLLSKSTGAQVVATGATATELLSIVNHLGNVASGGIQGTFALVSSLDATQLTSLLGKLDAAARVTADVSSMQVSQLAVLAANPGALDAGALTGALNLSLPLTVSAIGVLLDRYSGTTASLVADPTVGSDVLNAVAAAIGKFSATGISGALTILADVAPVNALGLLGQYGGTSASINASLFSDAQLQVLSGSVSKITTLTQPGLVLANTWVTPILLNSLLAVSTNAVVNASGAGNGQLNSLFSNLSHVANDGISGTLAVTSSLAAAPLSTFFQKVAVGATLSVDAALMDVDQVLALFANAGKIDSLSNLSVPNGTMARLPDDIGTLFQKGIGIKVDLTGASIAQVNDVARYLNQYANEGLTGTYTIDKSIPLNLLSPLLGATDSAANVTVQGDGMSRAQIGSVIGGWQSKVDAFNQLSLSGSDVGPFYMSSSVFSQILAKSTDLKLEVDALETAKLDILVSSLSHIADAGLTRPLKLSTAQFAIAGGASLDAKLAAATTVQLTGTASGDVVDLTGLSKQVYVDVGAGADVITLGSGQNTVFIGGKAQTQSGFSATDTSAVHIDQINGIKNGDVLKLSTAAGVFGSGLAFSQSASTITTLVDFNASNGQAVSFNDLYAQFSSEMAASTNTQIAMLKITIVGNSTGLTGSFLAINDGNATFNENDTIIKYVGDSWTYNFGT